jgi:TolB-like protein
LLLYFINFTRFDARLIVTICFLVDIWASKKTPVMNNSPFMEPDCLFSVTAVEQELENIFRAPYFAESPILKKFLSFVVEETLHGRSNCLKEYTIAIKVLEKRLNFNPQENGIVRIHAGRLRRALSRYYSEIGNLDQIVISIPKGKYVPFFANRLNPLDAALIDRELHDDSFVPEDTDSVILAVLPFICSSKNGLAKSFVDGLCLQISSTLMRLNQVSVIAYQAVKNLVEAQPDYKELGSSVGFNYIVTGGVQLQKNNLRVHIQLVECASYKQMWSDTFERKLNNSNLFKIEDELCWHVVSQVTELGARKYNDHKMLVHSDV